MTDSLVLFLFYCNPCMYTRPPTSHQHHPVDVDVDRRTPDERCNAPAIFPKKLRDLELGWRLDALDGQGGWFAATVVEVSLVSKLSCI